MYISRTDLPLPLVLLLVRRTGGRADEPEEVDAAAAVAAVEATGRFVSPSSSSSSSITMGIWNEHAISLFSKSRCLKAKLFLSGTSHYVMSS